MEENKEFSLLTFFNEQADLDTMKFESEEHKAVLIGEDLNEENLMNIFLTGLGRYYYAMRSSYSNMKVEKFKEEVKTLIDEAFDRVDNEYFNGKK